MLLINLETKKYSKKIMRKELILSFLSSNLKGQRTRENFPAIIYMSIPPFEAQSLNPVHLRLNSSLMSLKLTFQSLKFAPTGFKLILTSHSLVWNLKPEIYPQKPDICPWSLKSVKP